MKKYPYTDSTELITYVPEFKKKRKTGVFVPCIISALLASAITAGAFGIGSYHYLKPVANQSVSATAGSTDNTSGGATLITSPNGKTQLSVNEIAKKLGPSCVGVVNKAKLQPQRFYDPFSGRYYYYQNPGEGEMVEQGSGFRHYPYR